MVPGRERVIQPKDIYFSIIGKDFPHLVFDIFPIDIHIPAFVPLFILFFVLFGFPKTPDNHWMVPVNGIVGVVPVK